MKTSCLSIAFALGIIFLPAIASRADFIYTRDGRVYEGQIVEQDENTITILMPAGRVQIPRTSVERIDKQPTSTPTATETPTPRPTNTRFDTSTPTPTETPTPYPTREATYTPTPIPPPAAPYSAEEAEELISKYEWVQVPKAKYVLAYYSKGIQAATEEKRAAAIKFFTDALKINERLFYGPEVQEATSSATPFLESRFEAALETLRLEGRRDPAAAMVMNPASQRALRDINLLLSWVERQYNLHQALAQLYKNMQQKNLAVEHYLKAYRLISNQRRQYRERVEEKTAQGDPFNLRGLFFTPRQELQGRLVDARLIQIEQILDREFDLQPDDYLYDHE